MLSSVKFAKRIGQLIFLASTALIWSACGPDPGPIVIDDGKGDDSDDRLIRVSEEMPPLNLPEDNPLTQEGVELGRKLF